MEERSAPRWLARADLQRLIDALREAGHRVLGPTVRDGALVFDDVRRVADLPVGWRDEQKPGQYRLTRSGGDEVFGVVHGPGSLKSYTFVPREPLLRIDMSPGAGSGGGFRAESIVPDPERLAILGVRACDLAGLAVQDRVFLRDRFPDPSYAARRERLFLVAVGCTRSVETCFCASMDTGPEPRQGYDVALTELDGGFVVRAESEAGRALVDALALPEVPPGALERERAAYTACAGAMQRSLPREQVRELLYANLQHPRWDEVAGRCLSCGNCTMVCPTCFCHDVHDEPSLDLLSSVRVREWDSCFNREHAQVHGLNFRPQIRDRYRQWLVHKLASWVDQFDTSGCVGCGRCIAWCPVGIDLTEEVAAIAATGADAASGPPPGEGGRS
jgi:ferredoxin